MKYRNRILFGIWSSILIMLYLISSTDLIYKEQEYDIYQISVILNENNDVFVENFKLGLEQGDREWTTEINIVTLYENTSLEQQLNLIEREVDNGAQAIILFPVHTTLTNEYLLKKKWPVPIISVKDPLDKGVASVWVHGDDKVRSFELGSKMIENKVSSTYTLAPKIERDYIETRRKALEGVLSEAGIPVYSLHYETEKELEAIVMELAEKEAGTSIVALDSSTLTLVMNTYRKLENQEIQVYGMDYTKNILADLEKGRIKALAVTNDYDLGYLSLLSAIGLLQNEKVPYEQEVVGGVITKDTMYDPFYEKLLFPIY